MAQELSQKRTGYGDWIRSFLTHFFIHLCYPALAPYPCLLDFVLPFLSSHHPGPGCFASAGQHLGLSLECCLWAAEKLRCLRVHVLPGVYENPAPLLLVGKSPNMQPAVLRSSVRSIQFYWIHLKEQKFFGKHSEG